MRKPIEATLLAAGALLACPVASQHEDGGQCVCPDAGPACPGADGGPDAGALRSAWPQMPANLGRVLSPLTLVTLLASNDTDISSLEQFSDAVLASDWFKVVGADYGVGSVVQTFQYVGPQITAAMSEADVRAYIEAAINMGGVPSPNGNTLYLLYIPAMVSPGFTDETSCGYHNAFPSFTTNTGNGFAAVQRCLPIGSETQLDRLTEIASHEIIEAATDPTIRSYNLDRTPELPWTKTIWHSWASSGVVEVGDLCEGTFYRDDAGFGYQRVWSNTAAADGGDPCWPISGTPYFNVRIDQDWYSGAPGSTVSIPLTGWATGPTNSWLVNPHIVNALGGFQRAIYSNSVAMQLSTAMGPSSCSNSSGVSYTYPQMSPGGTGTLQVQVPIDAQPGDYAVFMIHNFQYGANCYASAGQDIYYVAVVGIYVN